MQHALDTLTLFYVIVVAHDTALELFSAVGRGRVPGSTDETAVVDNGLYWCHAPVIEAATTRRMDPRELVR